MTRKDWFYVPLPIVMGIALDEIIEKGCKRYGIGDRSELIRIIIGEFIMKYDAENADVKNILQYITNQILKKHKEKKEGK